MRRYAANSEPPFQFNEVDNSCESYLLG